MRRSPAPAALVALLTLAACAIEEPAPVLVEPTGLVTYRHPSGVFALDVPPTWAISDTSDAYALNVSFSPPDSPTPLVGVYVVTLSAFDPSLPPGAPPELNHLADLYRSTMYTSAEATYKEVAREPQPDGSLRIAFLIEAPQGTSQHNDFLQVNGPYFVALRVRLPDDAAHLRTLSRVVNTLSVDPTAAWVSNPEAAGGGAPHNLIDFAGLNAWVDRSGGFVIAGQVVNRTVQPLEFVRVNARLYDAEGHLLLERDNFVSSDLIQPNEYAPFSILFSDGLPSGVVRYDLGASGRYADYAAHTFYGPQNFALTSDIAFDENGLLVISGQVRNDGNRTAELVKVIAVVFDEQGRVVGMDTTLVDTPRLAPGEVSNYRVSFFELGGSASTFKVSVQGIASR